MIRTVAAHVGYLVVLFVCFLAVGTALALATPWEGTVTAKVFVFLGGAFAAAWLCRHWRRLTPLGAGIALLAVGLAWTAFVVYAVRGISLPTPYPYSWSDAAHLVLTGPQVTSLLASAAAVGVLLFLVRRAASPSAPI